VKLHPRSLVFRVLQGAQIGAVALPLVGIGLAAGLPVGQLLVPAVVVGVVVGVGFQVCYHYRFSYELTADTLDIGSGVFSRREREIPLRRIQNVDISREVVQRALGLAAVGIETAGGGETEASLRYVSYNEAKRLQRDIQQRKHGETGAEVADERTEREDLLFELGNRDLVLLGLVAPDLRALVPVLFFAVPAFGLSIPDLLVESGAFAVSPRAAVLAVVSWIGSGVVTAARYYGFRLTRLGDELRYERGLFSRYDGSIPLDKIQQVDVRENVLMRRVGYVALAVETAGYAPGDGQGGGSEATVPLAGRGRVFDLARSIDGFDFDEPDFTRPPRRARRRYAVRYALAVVVVTSVLYAANAGVATFVGHPLRGGWSELLDYWYVPLLALVLVPFAAHYKWLHRGYDVADEHVLTRNGFWRRTISVVPAYRVQTIIQTATPFQRWRSLATVVIDTAGSLSITDRGARAVDFDVSETTELTETVRRRLNESLVARRQHSDEPAGDISNE
jgi:putative membrane protein